MSGAVAHNTDITLISPHLKTMPKESTGKHHKHLPLKKCKIHFFDLKLASNITVFLGHGMSEAVVVAKFYDHGTRNYASFEQYTCTTRIRWTPLHYFQCKDMKATTWWATTSDKCWHLVLWPRRSQSFTQLAKKGSATVSKGKRMLLFLIQW